MSGAHTVSLGSSPFCFSIYFNNATDEDESDGSDIESIASNCVTK